MNKWGLRNGIVYGLILSAFGAGAMIMAVTGAEPGDSSAFGFVLGSLVYCGTWVFFAANSGKSICTASWRA